MRAIGLALILPLISGCEDCGRPTSTAPESPKGAPASVDTLFVELEVSTPEGEDIVSAIRGKSSGRVVLGQCEVAADHPPFIPSYQSRSDSEGIAVAKFALVEGSAQKAVIEGAMAIRAEVIVRWLLEHGQNLATTRLLAAGLEAACTDATRRIEEIWETVKSAWEKTAPILYVAYRWSVALAKGYFYVLSQTLEEGAKLVIHAGGRAVNLVTYASTGNIVFESSERFFDDFRNRLEGTLQTLKIGVLALGWYFTAHKSLEWARDAASELGGRFSAAFSEAWSAFQAATYEGKAEAIGRAMATLALAFSPSMILGKLARSDFQRYVRRFDDLAGAADDLAADATEVCRSLYKARNLPFEERKAILNLALKASERARQDTLLHYVLNSPTGLHIQKLPDEIFLMRDLRAAIRELWGARGLEESLIRVGRDNPQSSVGSLGTLLRARMLKVERKCPVAAIDFDVDAPGLGRTDVDILLGNGTMIEHKLTSDLTLTADLKGKLEKYQALRRDGGEIAGVKPMTIELHSRATPSAEVKSYCEKSNIKVVVTGETVLD